MARITFTSFVVIGTIPLLPYIIGSFGIDATSWAFVVSALLTFFTFGVIGYGKSVVDQQPKLSGVLETLMLGTIAAIIAYGLGDVLERVIA